MDNDEHTHIDSELIARTAQAMLESEKTVALTGAGISVASGIPPFRGEGGLWEKYNPEEYAHVLAFQNNPEKVWIMLKEMIDTIRPAVPNAAHHALAELEKIGYLEGIITGNVDFLHQAAGSKNVIELHGNNRTLVCMNCGNSYPIERYLEEMPPMCDCGSPLRPDVVFFGEPLPEKALLDSFDLAKSCNLMLVIGTSSMVSPMSQMPVMAKEAGARVVEINLDETHLTSYISDWIITGRVEEVLPRIVKELKDLECSS
jgi:NAD-dependent deacetylase